MKKVKSQLIGRLGNKTNDIKHFIQYLPFDVKNVIEPFGGSFSVIRICYYDDKYNKFVNDNDPRLYDIYMNLDEYAKFINFCNGLGHLKNNKTEFLKAVNEYSKNENFIQHFTNQSIIRGNIIKVKKICDYSEQINLFKKIHFSNDDYKIIIDKYKKDKNSFIFLDPPYLFSDNSKYYSQEVNADMTDVLVYLLQVFKDKTTKCKIMLIINKLNILEYLFKDYIVGSYKKIYSISKKKVFI